MVSQPRLHRPCREFPTRHHAWVRTAHQPRSTGFRAGTYSRGVTTPVSLVYLPVSLTAPGPSGSPEPTRLCRGCSHPPRRPPDQAASSFTSPLRQRRNGRSLTSIRKQQQRLVAHTNSTYNPVVVPPRPTIMPDGHWPEMPQVTAVDGQFGTHTAKGAAATVYAPRIPAGQLKPTAVTRATSRS